MSAEPNIRNRVAGAVVLVSLAVIFLPLILDGKKKTQILDSYIPEKPASGEIILINIDEQKSSEQQQDQAGNQDSGSTSGEKNSITIEASEITAAAEGSNKENEAEDEPASKPAAEIAQTQDDINQPVAIPQRNNRPNYEGGGHLVQIGSFGSRENASRLVEKLKTASYRSYYKTGTSRNKTIYRVFVGPYLNRDEAQQAILGLKKIADVNPIIVTYDPLKHSQG